LRREPVCWCRNGVFGLRQQGRQRRFRLILRLRRKIKRIETVFRIAGGEKAMMQPASTPTA